MTTTTESTAPPALDSERRADVSNVADTFVDLARTFTRARAKLLAQAQHDVEWSAHVVLKALSLEGPMRASDLADRIDSDPSTVSRQVAALVKNGFIERQADPEDGRASLLVPTSKADVVLEEHNEIRLEHFNRMLSDWTERDLRRFASLLRRFTHDFTAANETWLDQSVPRITTVGPQVDATEGH